MESSRQHRLDDYARKVIRYKATQLIGKCRFTRDDIEDLEQEMMLDLLLRLPRFDASKASLKTFIARIVDRKVSTLLRHRSQKKRDYRREVCSLDDPITHADGDSVREEQFSKDDHDLRTGRHTRSEIERTDMRLDISIVLSELSPELKALAERLLTQSIADAARDLKVPRSTLYGSGISRLRNLFEDKGLRDYLRTRRRFAARPGK